MVIKVNRVCNPWKTDIKGIEDLGLFEGCPFRKAVLHLENGRHSLDKELPLARADKLRFHSSQQMQPEGQSIIFEQRRSNIVVYDPVEAVHREGQFLLIVPVPFSSF